MPLSPGARLGPYEVVSLLGAGGMGEVYRARDPRLGRDVAIKVLPSELAGDEGRRRRFLREARAASALNHPGIVSIYELESADGVDFIVMEAVAGRTLEAVIRSGLRPGDAVRIALPIADALACAHAAGIVHRDLKPSNVMVGPDGTVKVLDFGLAKLTEPEGASGDEATTLSEVEEPSTLSRAGTIAGTPGYMSPEQATGGAVDARSDVFSFGALLYEMVTGRRAFTGTTRQETLRAVVAGEVKPPSEVLPAVPADLEKLILRCLRKEPERRFQHMSDVKVELQEIHEESRSTPTAAWAVRKRRSGRWIAAASGFALLLAVFGWLAWRSSGRSAPAPRVVKLTSFPGAELQPALSPDGEQLAFSWEGEGVTDGPPRWHIWLQAVGGSDARRLTSSPGIDSFPSWSPDGRQIAFARTPAPASGSTPGIYLVSPLAGSERRLAEFPAGAGRVAWTADGRSIVAAHRGVGEAERPSAGAIHLLSLDGGPPKILTHPPRGGFHQHPALSPSGRALAYVERENTGRVATAYLQLLELDERLEPLAPARRVTAARIMGVGGLTWAPDGEVLIYDEIAFGLYTLWRQDARGRLPRERIELAGRGAQCPQLSARRGLLVFHQWERDVDIWAFEPGSPARPWLRVSSSPDYEPAYSPDGRRVAFTSWRTGDTREIWLADADGTNLVQLTRGPGRFAGSPSWSPDGRRIAYGAMAEDGTFNQWTIDVAGGAPSQITRGPFNSLACWSRDGRWIYYRAFEGAGFDIRRVPAEGGSPERVTNHAGRGAPFAADRCVASPDGAVLYYKQADGNAPLIAHPLDGRPEYQVVDCIMGRNYDVTSQGIYYLGCQAEGRTRPLYRLDPASGRHERLGGVTTNITLGIAASPTGGPILFTIGGDEADIVMIENFR